MDSSLELVVKHYRDLTLDELYEIIRVRESVFVVEQKCPYQEVDGKDVNAYHVFLRDEAGIRGYIRVFPNESCPGEAVIGRVLSTLRRQGLAARLLTEGIRIAGDRLGACRITVEAQTYAKPLYEKAGFRQVSEEFLEDGIPHIWMLLEISGTRP